MRKQLVTKHLQNVILKTPRQSVTPRTSYHAYTTSRQASIHTFSAEPSALCAVDYMSGALPPPPPPVWKTATKTPRKSFPAPGPVVDGRTLELQARSRTIRLVDDTDISCSEWYPTTTRKRKPYDRMKSWYDELDVAYATALRGFEGESVPTLILREKSCRVPRHLDPTINPSLQTSHPERLYGIYDPVALDGVLQRLRVLEQSRGRFPQMECCCDQLFAGHQTFSEDCIDLYMTIIEGHTGLDSFGRAIALNALLGAAKQNSAGRNLSKFNTFMLDETVQYCLEKVSATGTRNEAAWLIGGALLTTIQTQELDPEGLRIHEDALQHFEKLVHEYRGLDRTQTLRDLRSPTLFFTEDLADREVEVPYKDIVGPGRTVSPDTLATVNFCHQILHQHSKSLLSQIHASDTSQKFKSEHNVPQKYTDILNLTFKISAILVPKFRPCAQGRDIILYQAIGFLVAREFYKSCGYFAADISSITWFEEAATNALKGLQLSSLLQACWICDVDLPALSEHQFLHFGYCEAPYWASLMKSKISDFDAAVPQIQQLLVSDAGKAVSIRKFNVMRSVESSRSLKAVTDPDHESRRSLFKMKSLTRLRKFQSWSCLAPPNDIDSD